MTYLNPDDHRRPRAQVLGLDLAGRLVLATALTVAATTASIPPAAPTERTALAAPTAPAEDTDEPDLDDWDDDEPLLASDLGLDRHGATDPRTYMGDDEDDEPTDW